ncbi:3559_t:CDS:2, partial [Rhizophagus irregularis]
KTETDINNSNINDSDINNMSLDSKKIDYVSLCKEFSNNNNQKDTLESEEVG